MTYEFLGLIFLLVLSGFFSSAELAFIVSNKLKIELLARKKNIAAKYAFNFINNPQTFFSTILISNNVVNIAFASLITIFLTKINFSEASVLLISTLLLLIFGEMIPKYIGRELSDFLLLMASIPLKIISIVLYPFVKLTDSISLLLTRNNDVSGEVAEIIHKDEIHSLIVEGSEVGKVDEEDSDIIKNIIDLAEQKVYEAMTPRTEIVGVSIDLPINEVIEVFIESGYSKLPVYEDNLDNIKGVINVFDMFNNPKNLESILREVLFVPETKKSLDMLSEFLEKRISFTVVVDEFGGTAGILTVEDLIEEMFGEIRDEYDEDPDVCKKIDDKTFVLSGRIEIDGLNEEYELDIPEGDYETIAGFITSHIGRIPVKGEKIKIENFDFVILHSTKIKINLVKMFVIPKPKENIL
ncbi:MAG: HlyC/CorC family transporter [Ignavibacteriales bacterium]|jgi:putative hemolysin|nr:HlyC/CorC family transporter [Ignavibacteriales bacterium]